MYETLAWLALDWMSWNRGIGRMRWLACVALIGMLTACSSASSSGGNVPERSAADLATVRAQAGLEEASPTAHVARPTSTPRPPTATVEAPEKNPGYATDESLYVTLLEPGDISTVWTRGGDRGIGVASLCGAPAIEEQFAPIGWAYGSYSAAGGEWAEQWVIRLIETDAQAAMDYARTSLTCDGETFDGGSGSDLHWDYEPLESPVIGDDLYAMRITMTSENPVFTPMVGNIVFARRGEFVVVLLHYGFSIDAELTSHMAEVAVERLGLFNDASV